MQTLFKNIHVLNPHQDLNIRADVLISDGVISGIGDQLTAPDGSDVHDASQWVMCPGLYDMHVHLREPGQTHKETLASGSAAAANGGFTGVCCMPNTSPSIDSVETVQSILWRSRELLVDVMPSAAITKGRAGQQLAPIAALYEAGVRLFTDDGDPVESPEVMRRAFEYASMFEGAVLSQHCEEKSMTKGFAMNEGAVSTRMGLPGYPSVAEELIIARDILLSEFCGNGAYHIQHMSAAGGVDLVRRAKASGKTNITCEVAPHHFVLTDEAVEQYGSNAKMNPPLRTQSDIETILEGFRDGTIDVIATDHAPHALHEKEVELQQAPNGIIGLETSLGLTCTYLLHTGIITLERLVELMAINPRKILSLAIPRIEIGEQANITIFAPNMQWKVDVVRFKTQSLNTPFSGWELTGKPIAVMNKTGFVWSEL